MSASFRTSTLPASSSSTSSLAICQLIARTDVECDPGLLYEIMDISFGSKSSMSSLGDVPPFPSHRPRLPPTKIVQLGANLNMFPQGLSHFIKFGADDGDDLSVCTTIPTSPRMKTMLRETLSVKKWTENIKPVESILNEPWGKINTSRSEDWVPSGSYFNPKKFETALDGYRERRRARSMSMSSLPAISPLGDSLVFEREVIVHTGGKNRRLSLSVPASNMAPEMVNMMLELQDLSSFFKGAPEGIPISSPPDSPGVLAVRRGRKAPPSLSMPLPPNSEPTAARNSFPYPNIPTPFLGSPSTYTPEFDFSNNTAEDDPSMGLEDMVASLRSRCVSMGDGSPNVAVFQNESLMLQQSPLSRITMTGQDVQEGEDDWEFAHNLMQTYGHKAFPAKSTVIAPLYPTRHASLPASKLNKTIEFDTPESSFANDASGHMEASDVSMTSPVTKSPTRRRNTTPAGKPPSIPLPAVSSACPPTTPRSGMSPPRHTKFRSILKSAKVVRFASPTTDLNAAPIFTPPSRAADVVKAGALKSSSPLKESFGVDSTEKAPVVPRKTPPTVATPKSPARRYTSIVTSPVREKSATPKPPTPRRATVSSPPSSKGSPSARKMAPALPKEPIGVLYGATVIEPGTPEGPKVPPKKAPSSLGRYSLGGKQTKPQTPTISTPSSASRWSTLDENMLRRGKSESTSKGPSRVRVPLRNIFKAFK
ncbi:hypothetical protein PLICRDRAFT_31431 [Plicaturopsis crispa FD-325 SS-3]|nr:hypothetical protein PLICRDRAFT_31431 [Plicaturopsis crispa FD-325 SS-3]